MNAFVLCNELLADLYQSAVTVPTQYFQQAVLKQLGRAIGFDRAWWGIMSSEQSGLDLHSSYRYELPAEFEAHWQAVKDDDKLAYDAHAKPRTTIHFNEKSLRSTPGLADLNTGHDIRHALCTSVFLPDQKSFLFISLFRSGHGAVPFLQDEIHLKQLLTPHLYACWRTNLLAEIQKMRQTNQASESASAFIDRKGRVIYADSVFTDLVSTQWPRWRRGQLPDQLINRLSENCSLERIFDLHVEHHAVGGLYRLDLRRPLPTDKLTEREREVAINFAQACSYKEIAAKLNLSPATVRHYLRVIYLKLEINDKAELVRMIDRCYRSTNLTADSERLMSNMRATRDIGLFANSH